MKRGEARFEVAALRTAAAESVEHVHRITGLDAAEGLGNDQSDVLVVDRPGWSAANISSFRALLAPALKTAVDKKPELAKEGSTGQVFGSAAAGAEMGGVLAFLSANVLGQFDPFHSSPQARPGRLLLVAPNVVSVAGQLNVDRDDFRLWVCLHEQTHRVQFAAAPWLAEHMKAKITELSTSTMGQADTLPQKLAEAARTLRDELKSGNKTTSRKHDDGKSNDGASSEAARPRNRLLEAIQSPQDREIMSHLTAVMSLLEGHANVVMDAVDSSIVPSVKTIRRRFEQRGKTRSPLEKLIRRLLQMDVKAASTATARSSSTTSSRPSAWRSSTRSGSLRSTCPLRRSCMTRTAGSTAWSCADGPKPAPIRGHQWVGHRRRCTPHANPWVRCSTLRV